MEGAAPGLDDRGKAAEIFERMECALPGISQRVLVFAVGEGNADHAVDRRADLADRVEFVLDDLRIGVQCLKKIAVEAAEIAVDLLLLLDLFDPVDGRRLAFIEQSGGALASQPDHRRGQIVAQRRQMRASARGNAACNRPAVDHDNPLALDGEFVSGREAGDAGSDDDGVATLVAIQQPCGRRDLDVHPERPGTLVEDICHGLA